MEKHNAEDVLDTFVTRLLEEKNLPAMDEEIFLQLKSDLKTRVEDRINTAILAQLKEEHLADFEALLTQADTETLQAFCKQSIPHFDEFIANEMLTFRKTYLDLQ
jgi:hypothetical protein